MEHIFVPPPADVVDKASNLCSKDLIPRKVGSLKIVTSLESIQSLKNSRTNVALIDSANGQVRCSGVAVCAFGSI